MYLGFTAVLSSCRLLPLLLPNLFTEKSNYLVFILNFKMGKLILLVKPLWGKKELFT